MSDNELVAQIIDELEPDEHNSIILETLKSIMISKGIITESELEKACNLSLIMYAKKKLNLLKTLEIKHER